MHQVCLGSLSGPHSMPYPSEDSSRGGTWGGILVAAKILAAFLWFLWASYGCSGKESAYNAEDTGLIPGLRRSPGEGNGKPLQYSCPENSMDRKAWWATVHGVTKNRARLSY